MTLDLPAILDLLPHRPPLLMLDRVTCLQPSRSVVAVKDLHHDDPWFSGHFPGRPVLPAVLLVEALAQAGAVLAACSPGAAAPQARALPALVGIENARVRRQVLPGQRLELHTVLDRAWGRFWKLSGRAVVDGEEVGRATILAGFLPEAEAAPGHAETSRA